MVARVAPDVRDHTGREQRVTGPQGESFVADHEKKIARHRVEPLVLLVVEMSRRSTLAHVGVLEDEQGASGISRRNLDLQRDDAPDHQLVVEAVPAIGYVKGTGSGAAYGACLRRRGGWRACKPAP